MRVGGYHLNVREGRQTHHLEDINITTGRPVLPDLEESHEGGRSSSICEGMKTDTPSGGHQHHYWQPCTARP